VILPLAVIDEMLSVFSHCWFGNR